MKSLTVTLDYGRIGEKKGDRGKKGGHTGLSARIVCPVSTNRYVPFFFPLGPPFLPSARKKPGSDQ